MSSSCPQAVAHNQYWSCERPFFCLIDYLANLCSVPSPYIFFTLSRDAAVTPTPAKDPMPRGPSLPQGLPRQSSSVLGAPTLLFIGSEIRYLWEVRWGYAPSPALGKDDLELAEGLSYPETLQEPHHCPGTSLCCCAVSQGRGGVRRGQKPVHPAWRELHPVLSSGAGVGGAPSW